jgi:hypothetical protein
MAAGGVITLIASPLSTTKGVSVPSTFAASTGRESIRVTGSSANRPSYEQSTRQGAAGMARIMSIRSRLAMRYAFMLKPVPVRPFI